MKLREARELGDRMASLVAAGNLRQASSLLAPILAERTPFAALSVIREAVGKGPLDVVNSFLDQIAASQAEGGWVVIGAALGSQLDRDLSGAFARARSFIMSADIWYAPDILGERVPGPALLTHFEAARARLSPWLEAANRWVRRTVGVAVHFWAKRTRGDPERSGEAGALLTLLEPAFSERNMDALKGIGWGIKTLGRHYPDLVADWLCLQLGRSGRAHRALMLRKGVTYLPEEYRARVLSAKT